MAENNNFWVDLIASLKKAQSKKQIKTDIKTLGDIYIPLIGKLNKSKTKKQVNDDVKSLGDIYVSLVGRLNKSKTKAQLKQDTASLNGTVDLTGKVNQKSIVTSTQQATQQAQTIANKNKIKLDASFNIKKSKLLADIQYFAQQNSKMMKDANMASRYNTLLDNAKLATSNKEIRNLRMQLSAMRSEIRANNIAGLTLGDTLKKTFKRAMELFSGTGFVMLLSQQLRQAWQESLNLDKAFTDLVKVQDELTRGDYPQYLEQCTRKAKELATTQQALIEGATEFSKSGYDLTTSNKLTEKATILANVGDMSASDSAKAIISGIQAYEDVDGFTDAVDKADALISKYNEIGNTAAITSAEIAQGVQAVGSVFADANTSVDEFIALLAATNRQYQDADSAALALRTAALRIRGCTVELEQMGEETDGVYTSASKLQEKIADLTNIDGNGGVKILDGDEFRSIYDIFVDLSKVYQQMSDVDQSALLELIAGKHRASAISATLNNMAEAQEIYKRSLESAGSAQEEYDKYLASSTASLNTFKANMIETYQAVFNGETTKAILDTGSSVLEFANSLGLVESTLKGFIAIGAVKGITALYTALKASALQASNFGKALQFANSVPNGNLSQRFSMLKNIAIASKSLNDAQLKLVLSNKALSNEDRIRVMRLMGMEKSLAEAKLAEMGLTQATNAQSTAQKAATINTFSLSAAVKGLGNNLKLAFMSNPVGITIMALSTAIGAVTAKVSEYNESLREARQADMDAASSIKDQTDELNELYIKYNTLSSITDKTSQEEDDFRQVVEDITKALGDKSDALKGVATGTDEYAKSLREATKAELEGYYATAKVGAKAAEEALKDKTYSAWDGSQITIAKNEQMTGIKEHVAALEAVQDILAKYEDLSSNGIEWEPINWDKNQNDMNTVLEYYYDLVQARDKLATADNADFLMSSDVYKDINTTINNLKDSVEAYTEQQYNALKLQYEWQNGIPRTKAEFNAMEESILSASGAGVKFQEVLKGFLINDFTSFFPEDTETEIVNVEKATKSLFNILISSKESLDKFTSSVESAYESYSKLMNPNVSSSEIISAIQSISSAVSDMGGELNWEAIDKNENSLELLGEAIEDISRKYAESVLSGAGIDVDSKFGQMLANNIIQAQKSSIELENLNDGLDSLQSAYSSLTDIVESYNKTGYFTFDQLQSLLELEPQYLACLIDENGQLQLNEQAMTALANQRLNDAEAQAVQQAITELGEIALQDEKVAVEENGTAFENQIAKLAGYNQELSNTIAEATVGAAAIRDLNAAIQGAESQGASNDQIQTVLDNLNLKLNAINSVRGKLQAGGLGDVAAPKFSSKKEKKEKDTTKEFDWIENAIASLEKRIQSLQKVIDSSFSTTEAKSQALVEQIDLINQEIELQQKAYDTYMAKAESVGLSDKYKNLIQNGDLNIEDITDEELQKAIDSYTEWYNKAQETQDKITDLREDNLQTYVDLYDLKADEINKIRDNGGMTEKEYLNEMTKLWKTFFNKQVDYAEIAKERKLDLLEDEKDYLESVVSAATNLLDDEIDSVEKAKDNATKGYKAEIEVLEDKIDAIEEQKDVLQDQIDLIEEQKSAQQEILNNLEKERIKQNEILDVEQKRFNLKRAENQNTVKQYQDGQMIYTTDSNEIKNARQELDDAEFTLEKRKIQDVIDQYDKQIDSLNKQIDGLDKVIDGYNKQIDALNDLIDKSDAYYDGQITNLENIKSEWEKLLEIEQRATDMKNFTDMFGEGSIAKLLTGDMSMLTQWKDTYASTLAEIDLTTQDKIGSITEKFAELAGVDLSKVTSQFSDLNIAVENTSSAIDGTTAVGNDGQVSQADNSLVDAIDESYNVASDKIPAESEMMNELTDSVHETSSAIAGGSSNGKDKKKSESSDSLTGAMDESYNKATDTIPAETDMMSELKDTTIQAKDEVVRLGEEINNLPDEKVIKIKIETEGTMPNGFAKGTVGNAFAEGTKYKGLAHDEKNALRSEYGQPELTVYPNGKAELTTEPTMSDLPKDTVIYNEEQTKKIMNNKPESVSAAFEGGTVKKVGLPSYLRPIQEGDPWFD